MKNKDIVRNYKIKLFPWEMILKKKIISWRLEEVLRSWIIYLVIKYHLSLKHVLVSKKIMRCSKKNQDKKNQKKKNLEAMSMY